MKDTRTVGQRIKAHRDRRGLHLVQLAESTGLSVPFLSRVERGERTASYRSLERIAEALGVGVRSLIPPRAA
jgi:transcriptional regulator with XRE-family HTH domain